MKIQTKKFLLLEIAAVILAIFISVFSLHLSAENTSSSSTATDNRPPPGSRPSGPPPMPPPEALQACAGKTSGAACSFTGREGTAIEGLCFGPPSAPRETTSTSGNNDENRNSNAALACRPKHGIPPPQQTSKPTQ